MNRTIIFSLSFLAFLISAFLLISGSSALVEPIIKETDFLYGTLITWIGLATLPLTVVSGIKNIYASNTKTQKTFKLLCSISMIVSVLWILVGFFLANNWNFIFESGSAFRGGILASKIFWFYTSLCVLMPIILLASYLIHRLCISIRKA